MLGEELTVLELWPKTATERLVEAEKRGPELNDTIMEDEPHKIY